MVTKEEFEAYEAVRTSGVTNMWDTKLVCELSGLDKTIVREIMKHYVELKLRYC